VFDSGADVNRVDKYGNTPLSWAAYEGYEEIVKLLLSAGADVNLADKVGQTPFWIAADKGHLEIARLLIANGAEITQNILKKLIQRINDISELASLFDAIVTGYETHLLKLAKRYQNQLTEETIDIKSQVKSLHSKIMPDIESSLFERINSVVSTNLKEELLEDYRELSSNYESKLNFRKILIESLGSLRYCV
jgi:predicted regulator of amino acid metabolism with ACT domain